PPATGPVPSLSSAPRTSPTLTMTPNPSGPQAFLDPRRNYTPDSIVIDPTTEPAPPPEAVLDLEPVIELRHPKAVPALLLSDAVDTSRSRHRALAGHAALVVGAAAALALAVTQIGSCAMRLGHSQTVSPASRPGEVTHP